MSEKKGQQGLKGKKGVCSPVISCQMTHLGNGAGIQWRGYCKNVIQQTLRKLTPKSSEEQPEPAARDPGSAKCRASSPERLGPAGLGRGLHPHELHNHKKCATD